MLNFSRNCLSLRVIALSPLTCQPHNCCACCCQRRWRALAWSAFVVFFVLLRKNKLDERLLPQCHPTRPTRTRCTPAVRPAPSRSKSHIHLKSGYLQCRLFSTTHQVHDQALRFEKLLPLCPKAQAIAATCPAACQAPRRKQYLRRSCPIVHSGIIDLP